MSTSANLQAFDLPGYGRTWHKEYESMAAFVSALPSTIRYPAREDDWAGGLSYADAMRRTAEGSPKAVRSAQRLLDKVELSGLITRGAQRFVPDVAGAFPNVPAYLACDPACMWRKGETEQSDTSAPVRVFLDCCSSASITAKELETRGAAAMALVLALSERRPVDLLVFSSLGDYGGRAYIPAVRIESRPLDMAAASFAMAHAAFLRTLCMSWAAQFGYQNGWAWGEPPMTAKHRAGVRTLLGATDQDVVLHAPHMSNQAELNRPMDWLKERLAEHFSDVDA